MRNFAAAMSVERQDILPVRQPASSGMAAVIGFFDGVHRGHRHLLATLVREARRRGLRPMAVTFASPPRQVLHPEWRPRLLTTPEERRRLLLGGGVERVEMLCFTPAMALLSAREFMQQVLQERLGVRLLVVGYDTRFGHHRRETPADYRRYGGELGMEVVEATCLEGCSSSLIRQQVERGCVDDAAVLLGRPYSLAGVVERGLGNGHKIGFPTANMRVDNAEKLIPAAGAYATRTRIGDGPWHRSMTDIGLRPTFRGDHLTVETHILGLCEDLYGRRIEVEFGRWLRPERTFPSPEALGEQLRQDARQSALLEWPEGCGGAFGAESPDGCKPIVDD